MICAYAADAADFTTNGLGPLRPLTCEVSETLNGMWELVLTHPMDEKSDRLAVGNIIKAPVPAGFTPAVKYSGSGSQTSREIWRVNTTGIRLYLRAEPDQSSKGLHAYRPGTEVVVLDKSRANWYEVTTPDGKHGYMWSGNLAYVRTETSGAAAEESIKEAAELREQPFRIYKIAPGLETVTVYARHVFYDLADNLLGACVVSDQTGAAAAAQIMSATRGAHPFRIMSDIDAKGTADWTDKTPIEAIMGGDGLCEIFGAEIARDWFDVYAVQRVGRDTDIEIRQGKNLQKLSGELNISDVITRIVPIGTDVDGKPLYLPEVYVDSDLINDYALIKWGRLDVRDAKESTSGDNKKTKEDCYKLMRDAAQAQFDAGADMAAYTLDVDFINLADTVEFAEWAGVNDLALGDSVRIYAPGSNVDMRMRMTDYVYDCLQRRYKSVSMGSLVSTIAASTISSKQLPSGVISGGKIARGAVSAQNIADGSVNSLKIGMAAIEYAHIKNATVQQLSADAITAVRADVRELVAGKITTDQFYADLAEIATAQITTAHIKNATIDWAQITTLSAEIAKVAQAEIKSATIDGAHIKNASIDTAQIKNGAISTALIGTGAVNTAQIADGSITDAKIVELTANKINAGTLAVERLIISGSNKSIIYAINNAGDLVSKQVDTIDGYALTPRTVTADKIVANAITAKEIASKAITANEIAANTITAGQIASGTITATQIDVANLFAAQATVAALDAYIIKANTITALKGQLDVWASDKISIGIKDNVGNPNLLLGTKRTDEILIKGNSDETFYPYGEDYPDKRIRVTDHTNAEFFAYVATGYLIDGQKYTFSVDVGNFGNDVRLRVDTTYSEWGHWNNSMRRLSVTFIAKANTNYWLRVICKKRDGGGDYFDVRKFKLEYGSEATGWRESDEEFRNSAVMINKDGIRMIGGSLDFDAGTLFKVKSGGAVQIDASSAENSYINLGDGNFSASKQGGVTADVGNFKKLLCGGKPVLTDDNLPMPIIVSKNNPGKHNVVWLQPSSVASVDYTFAGYTSRRDANDFGITHTISASFTAVNSDTLANGTLKYRLEIPLYSLAASLDNFSLDVKLTKGSSTVTMTRVNNIVIRPYNEVIAVCEFTSTTNLCSNANAITVEMTGTKAGSTLSDHVYIQKDRTLKLTISTSGSGSAQACNVYYLP